MDGSFDINDSNLVSSDKLIFSAKGEKKRVCVRDAKIAMVEVHAVMEDKKRRLKLCTRTDVKSCKYCDQGFSPSRRYGLRVFEYFKRGSEIDLRLISWVFSQDKLDALKKGLGNKVLKGSEWNLVCTNDTFQAFSIKSVSECLLLKDKALLAKAKALSGKVKADGVVVLRALLSPSMPVETTKKRGRGDYGPPQEYGPPQGSFDGGGGGQETPVSSPPQASFDDALQELVEAPSQESPSETSAEPLSENQNEGSESKKEEDWEKSLNDILGDFE